MSMYCTSGIRKSTFPNHHFNSEPYMTIYQNSKDKSNIAMCTRHISKSAFPNYESNTPLFPKTKMQRECPCKAKTMQNTSDSNCAKKYSPLEDSRSTPTSKILNPPICSHNPQPTLNHEAHTPITQASPTSARRPPCPRLPQSFCRSVTPFGPC
jgi:hypothetical protein